jgi:hypothetical protein
LLSLENLHLYGDLEVFEFEELPQPGPPDPLSKENWPIPGYPGYSAISYVWRGLSIDNDLLASRRVAPKGNFTIKGGEDGDPISISVLEDIAWADGTPNKDNDEGVQESTGLLWLDQLCIMQTSDDDKAWQIEHIYEIYRNSYCFVLPGGLTRLVSPTDTNNWMSRGWTLQEVLAPDPSYISFLCMTNREINDIFEKQYHDMSVRPYGEDTFITCIAHSGFTSLNNWSNRPPAFGFTSAGLEELSRGSRKYKWVSDATESDIWRSNWPRTSSRPVDMVFSIMQCFGVNLNPKLFHKDERVRATIALAKAILEKPKGRANWIGSLWFLPPAPELSVFPQFPKTKVDGSAIMQMPDGTEEEVIQLMRSNKDVKTFEAIPEGHLSEFSAQPTMDDEGYYNFVANEIYILREADDSQKKVLRAGDGSKWCVANNVPDLEYRKAHPDELADSEGDDDDGGDDDRDETSGTNDSGDDGDDDDTEDSSGKGSEADLTEEYLPNLQDIEGDVLAVLLFWDSELRKSAYMLLRKHGPRKYHRFTHLIVNAKKYDPFEDVDQNLRQDVRISVGPFPGRGVNK